MILFYDSHEQYSGEVNHRYGNTDHEYAAMNSMIVEAIAQDYTP